MTQLVREIIVDREEYESASDEHVVYAVGDFVRALLSRHFRYEEMPAIAVQSYSLDYYFCQIQNGNIGQFVTNNEWQPVIVEAIRAALLALGAQKHLELFEEVAVFVESTRPELEAAIRDGQVVSYWERVNALRGGFYQAFTEAGPTKDGEDLCRMNAAWIRTWKVRGVENEDLKNAWDALQGLTPDLEARKEHAWQSLPWQIRRIEKVVSAAGQSIVGLNGADAIVHDGTIYPCSHISTSAGHHHVVFRGKEAVLYRGFGDEIVAAVPAPEATDDRELEGWEKMSMRRLQN